MFLTFTFLSLISLCAASPANIHKRIDAASSSGGSSSKATATSILVLTGSPNAAETVTFYASRVSDTQLWTITTTTVVSSTETVYPSGYEWVPSPAPQGPIPAIPTDALFPTPGEIPISFPQKSSTASKSATQASTSVGSTSVSQTSESTSSGASPSPSASNGSSSASQTSGSSTASGSAASGSSSSASASGSSSTPSGDGSTSLSNGNSNVASSPSSTSQGSSSSTGSSGSIGSSDRGGPSSSQSGQSKPASSGISNSGESSSATSSIVVSSVASQNNSSTASLSSASSLSSGSVTIVSSSKVSQSATDSVSGSEASSGSTGGNAGSSTGQAPSVTAQPGASKSDEPTTSFVYPILPSSTVSGAAATSNAAKVGVLFFALHANLPWLSDPKLKSQYIDNVDKIKQQTDSLFNNLDTKPPIPAPCVNPKKKRDLSPRSHGRRRQASRNIVRIPSVAERSVSILERRSFLSGITDLIGDVGKLVGCATGVLDKLSQDVKLPDPPTAEIEDLTGALQELGDDLQNEDEDNNPSNTASNSDPSSTKNEDSASSSPTSSPSSRSSASSTVSSSSSSASGADLCAPTCAACLSGAPTRKDKRSNDLEKRTLEDLDNYDGVAEYTLSKIGHGGIELWHRSVGALSSANSSSFGTEPHYLWTQGLYGCTAVVIIGEAGVWFGHFWEDPSFIYADENNNFETQVLNSIRNGDGKNMPAAFGLQQSGQILAAGSNVQIFISTPKQANGDLIFPDQVQRLTDTLSGNSAPFSGAQVTTRGYLKPPPGQQVSNPKGLELSPKYKVLIEYDNNQVDDPPAPNQRAIWRLFLETQVYTHEWDATETQRGACALPSASGHQKRDEAAGCSRPSQSNSASSGASSPASSKTTDSADGSSSSGASSKGTPTSGPSTTSLSSKIDSTTGSGTGPITTAPSLKPSSTAKAFTNRCSPFEDPDAGITEALCQCEGLSGMYPALTSPPGGNFCGYTTSPTRGSTSIPPFTTTESDGEVLVCETSTYFNYAVLTDAECAGSRKTISTVESIASSYSSSVSASIASASSASAEASWSSAAAVPSAACWILDDDGWGDSAFAVYGINGWAGDHGEKLLDQEDGCGILSGWQYHTGERQMFEGRERDTSSAAFGLSFFKGGCVERAVHSAGGPEPGNGPGQLACKHGNGPVSDVDLQSIKSAQLTAVSHVASASAAKPRSLPQRLGITAVEEKRSETSQYDPDLIASAKAALPHLQAAVASAGGPQQTQNA